MRSLLGSAFVKWMPVLGGMFVVLHVVLPHLLKQRQIQALRDRARGRLVLTYDDGPDPSFTPRLLERLATLGVRASFFMTGQRAGAHGDLVRRIADGGHHVASHSGDHRHPWKSLPWAVAGDVARGHARVAGAAGRVSGYRPQYGKLVGTSWIWSKLSGVPLHWWTVDSGDSQGRLDPGALVDQVRAVGGGVVLFHDGVTTGPRASYVLDATEALVRMARDEGWEITTQDELG